MSDYTRAIYFKNGDTKTITESEYRGVIDNLLKGAKWVQVQGSLISADTIARVDTHQMTAQMKKTAEADLERKLELTGRRDLVDMRRKLAEAKTIEHCQKENFEETAMTTKEVEDGEPAYYVGEDGQKYYS